MILVNIYSTIGRRFVYACKFINNLYICCVLPAKKCRHPAFRYLRVDGWSVSYLIISYPKAYEEIIGVIDLYGPGFSCLRTDQGQRHGDNGIGDRVLQGDADIHPFKKQAQNGEEIRVLQPVDIPLRHGKKLGKKIHPHALRHSLATNLLGANNQHPVISEILGHSSTESTRTYTRVNVDMLRQCALDVPFVPSTFYGSLYE